MTQAIRTLQGRAVAQGQAWEALPVGLVMAVPNGTAASHAVAQLRIMLPALSWAYQARPNGDRYVAVRGTVTPAIARLAVALLEALADRNEAIGTWDASRFETIRPSQRGQTFTQIWGPSLFMTRWACPGCGGGTHQAKGSTLGACCSDHLGESQPTIKARWLALRDASHDLADGMGGLPILLPPRLRIR